MSDNENNNIELNEDEYNEDVNESLSDTFSNIDEDNKIKSNEIKKDSIEETDDNK